MTIDGQTSSEIADVFADNEEVKETETHAEETETQEETPEQTIRVKYNGVEQELKLSDAITYAQKGMNYDKIKSAYDVYEKGNAKGAMALIQALADENSMTTSEYMDFANKNLLQTSINTQMKQIKQEYPDMPDEAVRELAQSRAEKRAAKIRQDREEKEQAPWNDLVENYPDIKTSDDLPEEVKLAISSGKNPLMAMREYEIRSLKSQIEKMNLDSEQEKQNQKNSKNAIGNVKGDSQPKHDEIWGVLDAGD